MTHLIDICSCCSGGSNPICIPDWRAEGCYRVDPPHLRWNQQSRGAPVLLEGLDVTRGVGRACKTRHPPSRCGTPVERTCTCWVLLQRAHYWLYGELVPDRWKHWARCTPWRWAVWGDRRGKDESGPD